MSWWIGIRSFGKKDRPVIVPLKFNYEEEAEREQVILKKAGNPSTEVCQPVQADTEQEAIKLMKDLMGW